EFAKNLKTPEDLNQFSRMLKKITVEAALNAELTDHLGYEKHQPRKGKNARNGYTSKTVMCDEGEMEIDTPRDREGTFEPQLIKKNQTRITGMDEQIIALYAKGLSNQEIVEMFKELYDADVSTSLISRVTDSVKERVLEWQNRPLDAVYPIVY
ncbi:transposase, partial [Avibacterium avium]